MASALSSAREQGIRSSAYRHFRREDAVSLVILAFGWLVMYAPTYWGLATSVWVQDEQGHGPIILGVSLWLLAKRLSDSGLGVTGGGGRGAAPWAILAFGLIGYVVGRSQSIWMLEVGSQIPVLSALLLLVGGWPELRRVWFPVLFLAFMIPLPEAFVAMATAPLKQAVAASASSILHTLGYPVGRAGVTLNIAQYQLFVADACAGLNSIFTLEALGLLYMHLMGNRERLRNLVLATSLVPISFCANVVRVMVLVLVTYYWGDAAAQGFIHQFAGILLFAVALMLMLLADAAFEIAQKVLVFRR